MRTLYESILDVNDNIVNTEPWKNPHEKVIYFFNILKSSLPQSHITHTPSSSGKSSTFHINKSSEYNYKNNVIEISISYKLWYERGKLILDSPKLYISNIVGGIGHPIFRNYIDLSADKKFINKKSWSTTNTDRSYGQGSIKYELNIDLIEEFFKKFEKLPNLYDKLCKDIISSDIVKNTDEFKELDYSSKCNICAKILEKSLHKLLQ